MTTSDTHPDSSTDAHALSDDDPRGSGRGSTEGTTGFPMDDRSDDYAGDRRDSYADDREDAYADERTDAYLKDRREADPDDRGGFVGPDDRGGYAGDRDAGAYAESETGSAPSGFEPPRDTDGEPVLLPVDPPADHEPPPADQEPTRADQEPTRADQEPTRADRERARADQERDVPPAPTTGAATTGSTAPANDAWHELQSRFVDDPAAAVRDAGALVEKALTDLRSQLERGNTGGDTHGDTEDLRMAFRRYRDLYGSLR
jgi:hypothetical protein